MLPAEKSSFEAAVQKEVQKVVAAQQKQLARAYEKMMKDGLKGVDKANAALRKQQKALEKELDAVKKELAKVEKTADKLAEEYFAGRQKQFAEAARTELLRNLSRMHIEIGKSNKDIAVWLDVPQKFVDNIRQVVERVKKFAPDRPQRTRIEGSPKLRYVSMGRGGTVYFESHETNFDMWWEYAGGDALVILEIPSREKWEERTGIPSDRREKTLLYMAEQVLLDQIPYGGSFIIGDTVITFYERDDKGDPR